MTPAILWNRDLSPLNAWTPTTPSGMRPSLPAEVCMSVYYFVYVFCVYYSDPSTFKYSLF